MTPPQAESVHVKFFGNEIDLKGAATKRAPILLAILALGFSVLALWRIENVRATVDGSMARLDGKIDKILFILASE